MRRSLESVLHYPDAVSQVQATAEATYWLATIAAEDGRVTVRRTDGNHVVDVTPEANVRSRAMEYGGGAYSADGLTIAYCDDRTKRVHLVDGDAHRPITPADSQFVYGGLHLSLADGVVLAVREDHSAEPEPRTEIVALSVHSDGDDEGRVVATGADFYAGPVLHGGRVAWYQWNHPNMSWDTASVWTASLADPSDAAPVYERDGVSAQHPLWLGDGKLAYVTDEHGYWNWRVDGGAEWRVDHDCDGPTWVLNGPQAAVVDERSIATVEYIDGRGVLAVWDTLSGDVTRLLTDSTDIESVAASAGQVVAVVQWADRPATVTSVAADGVRAQLAGGAVDGEVGDIALPQSHWADGPAGPVQGWLYLPSEPNPPLIVFTHGGPTAMAGASYDATIQFWVSRGFAVVDVNYSGSTGFGSEYRDRLRGQWGELDVADAEAMVRSITGAGLADPARVAITGGSAGGFTTLKSLVSTDVYAAGISRYGIGYLPTLATDTHKAESRYLDGLIAPWPDGREVYEDRSPVNHLAQLKTPMLILQGLEDKVVPPNQAEQMADAVRSAGLPVALIMFEGEGHGFRSMAARKQSLEAQVSFLEQVFGMERSDDVPTLEIENL